MAEVKEGGDQAGSQEGQGEGAADRIKGLAVLVLQQPGDRIELSGIECKEQALADAEQGG